MAWKFQIIDLGPMELNRSHIPLLWGFITISLLLHLLLLFLLPERRPLPPPKKEEPVVVEVRPPEPRQRELDLPLPEKEEPRDRPAKRLGPADQQVEQEIAPEGDAPEDRAPPSAVATRPAPEPSPPVEAKQQPRPRPEPVPQAEPEPSQQVPRPEAPPRAAAPPDPVEPVPPVRDLPDLSALTRLPAATIARLEDQWRRKYREDVERGDAVWLDTERDILFSFFNRFRTNIYNVWNYPPSSAARKEEGTCLLRIAINRDGTVEEVEVMESSGYHELDMEAVAAVHKGSPYGDLPRAYTEEALSIFAFFEYTLTRRLVY